MSTQICSMRTTKGELTLTRYPGGNNFTMFQITQGPGTIMGPDTPGFIQLTMEEALALAKRISTLKTMQPCPFCGAATRLQVLQNEIGHSRWVNCKSCRTEGPMGSDEDEAVELWNTRGDVNV